MSDGSSALGLADIDVDLIGINADRGCDVRVLTTPCQLRLNLDPLVFLGGFQSTSQHWAV